MCGSYRITGEQLEDFSDMCSLIVRKFSWEHSLLIITTSNPELAEETDEVTYSPKAGSAIDDEFCVRFTLEYNVPQKLDIENLTSLLLTFEKLDSLGRFIFKRSLVYNSFFKYRDNDGSYWRFIGRPDAIELFDEILYPDPKIVRNPNNTESVIREIDAAVIKMCALKTNVRQTTPLLRAVFRNRLEKMRLLRSHS